MYPLILFLLAPINALFDFYSLFFGTNKLRRKWNRAMRRETVYVMRASFFQDARSRYGSLSYSLNAPFLSTC